MFFHGKFLVSLVLSATLVACAPVATEPRTEEAPEAGGRVARVLVDEGFRLLEAGRLDDASRVFNAALKFEPENASLHFLNGYTYHQQYLRGDNLAKTLAETGYRLALNFEPAHFPAAYQQARLHFASRDFSAARDAFLHAYDIDPTRTETYIGLAAASYYLQDVKTALWATTAEALRHAERDPVVLRLASMVNAAAGQAEQAEFYAARYADLSGNSADNEFLQNRLQQWRRYHTTLAQAPVPAPPPNAKRDNAIAPRRPYPQVPDDKAPASRRWDECDEPPTPPPAGPGGAPPAIAGTASPAGAASATINDGNETIALPALPSPCYAAGLPRMAVLDVVIIRTEDTVTRHFGINLLDGLSIVFSGQRGLTDQEGSAASTPGSVRTLQRSLTLGTLPSPAGIGYSLNIANATDSRNEVLARPSLVALDRQPSMFFSGSTVTLGIAGSNGSSSIITDKPVGISLSATPTFVDDETLLLAVKAARSFIEEGASGGTFSQQLHTSRNSVTANVALSFGQTLVLSGLSERETQRNYSGVPVLKDIPGLQYLFKNRSSFDFESSVLILVTPRKPIIDADDARAARNGNTARHKFFKRVDEYFLHLAKASPNLDSVVESLGDNKFYLQFRKGDVVLGDPSPVRELIEDFKSLLYF